MQVNLLNIMAFDLFLKIKESKKQPKTSVLRYGVLPIYQFWTTIRKKQK